MDIKKFYEPLTEERLEEIKKLQKVDIIYAMLEGETHSEKDFPITENELRKMPELNESVEGYFIRKDLGDQIIPPIMSKEKYDMYVNNEVPLPKLENNEK
mgnify:CR=1 FL=1